MTMPNPMPFRPDASPESARLPRQGTVAHVVAVSLAARAAGRATRHLGRLMAAVLVVGAIMAPTGASAQEASCVTFTLDSPAPSVWTWGGYDLWILEAGGETFEFSDTRDGVLLITGNGADVDVVHKCHSGPELAPTPTSVPTITPMPTATPDPTPPVVSTPTPTATVVPTPRPAPRPTPRPTVRPTPRQVVPLPTATATPSVGLPPMVATPALRDHRPGPRTRRLVPLRDPTSPAEPRCSVSSSPIPDPSTRHFSPRLRQPWPPLVWLWSASAAS